MRPAAALAALFLLFIAADALACSCARVSPALAFAQASKVFEGKVVDIDDQYSGVEKAWDAMRARLGHSPRVDWSTYAQDYGFAITFELTRGWKGTSQKRAKVLTGRGRGDCGIRFEKGKTYLVYAYCSPDHGCQTNICTRTNESTYATEDYRALAARPVLPLR